MDYIIYLLIFSTISILLLLIFGITMYYKNYKYSIKEFPEKKIQEELSFIIISGLITIFFVGIISFTWFLCLRANF